MSKVILQGYILVADEELELVTRELELHKELTREEIGCLVFEVEPDESAPNRFNVYEEFQSKGAFEHHQQRVSGSMWGKVTKNVSRHYQVTYDD